MFDQLSRAQSSSDRGEPFALAALTLLALENAKTLPAADILQNVGESGRVTLSGTLLGTMIRTQTKPIDILF